MCHKEEETVNHLFLHCEVAIAAWSHFIGRCGIVWCCPETIAALSLGWEGILLAVGLFFGG